MTVLHRRETPAGDRLPYARHRDARTLVTRDGRLCQFIHLRGLAFETEDTEALNYRHALRETMLRGLADPHFAIYHHILRRPVTADLPGGAPPGFCAELDDAWRDRLAGRQMFANELFLTIVRRPLRGGAGLLDRFVRDPARDDAAAARDLDAAVEAVLRSLAPYGARRLSTYETRAGTCSEPLEFLSFLYNADLRPVLLPRADLGQAIPRRRVSFGGDTIDLAGATAAERRFSAMVSIKDYPAATAPGLLDALLRLPHELVVSQSFGFVDRSAALSRMDLALRRLRAGDDAALSLRHDLTRAKDDVAAGRSGFGEHHLTVQVRVSDLAMLGLATLKLR